MNTQKVYIKVPMEKELPPRLQMRVAVTKIGEFHSRFGDLLILDKEVYSYWLKEVDRIVLTREEFEEIVGAAFEVGQLHEYERSNHLSKSIPSKEEYLKSL